MFCTSCGTKAIEKDKFCNSCGAQLSAPASTTPPNVTPAQTIALNTDQSSPLSTGVPHLATSPTAQTPVAATHESPLYNNPPNTPQKDAVQPNISQPYNTSPLTQQQSTYQYAGSTPQQAWAVFAQQEPTFDPLASHQPLKSNNPGTLVSPKKRKTALILACIPHTGWFGVHRMYLGYIGIGILQLFTIGGFFIWWIVDIVNLARGTLTDKEGRPLEGGDINAWAVKNEKRIAGESTGVTTQNKRKMRVIIACILFAFAITFCIGLVRNISQSQVNVRIFYYGYINAPYSFQTKTIIEGRIIIGSTEGYSGIYDFETNMFSVVSGTFWSPDYLGNYTVSGPLGDFGHLNSSAGEYEELLSGELDELDVSEDVSSIIGDINNAARIEAEGNRRIGIIVASIIAGVTLITGLLILFIKPGGNKQALRNIGY